MSFNWLYHNKYYLVFTESTVPLLRKVLNKRIAHIFILKNDGYNWFKINPRQNILQWEICNNLPQYDIPRQYAKQGAGVIEISLALRNSKSFFMRLSFLNCVLFATYAIGLKLKAFTPWQLYKKLNQLTIDDYPKYGIHYIKILS